MRSQHLEVFRKLKCSHPVELRHPCDSSWQYSSWQLLWMSSLSQDKSGQVDAISKEMVPEFGGTTKLIRCALNSMDPLQRAAFSKDLTAKLYAARRCDAVEHLAPSECGAYVPRHVLLFLVCMLLEIACYLQQESAASPRCARI